MDFARLLHRVAAWHGDRLAVEDAESGGRLTFRQLDARSNALANALVHLSPKPQARVAILLRNRIEFIESDLGVTKAAKVKVPIHHRLASSEREYILGHAAVESLIADALHQEFSG